MARTARVVIPGCPHHVTHRGNRKQAIFLAEGDEAKYLSLVRAACRIEGVELLAYCLMPNHVHLILVPESRRGISEVIRRAHGQYSSFVNIREGWTGSLFAGRFYSTAMDSGHLSLALLYVEQNPVRAGMVAKPADYRWSSARTRAQREFEESVLRPEDAEKIRSYTRSGIPLTGPEVFDQL